MKGEDKRGKWALKTPERKLGLDLAGRESPEGCEPEVYAMEDPPLSVKKVPSSPCIQHLAF